MIEISSKIREREREGGQRDERASERARDRAFAEIGSANDSQEMDNVSKGMHGRVRNKMRKKTHLIPPR